MTVIAIFDCDEWKTRQSMRLIMISSPEKLEENLKRIKKEHEYSDQDMKDYIFTEEYVVDNGRFA